VPHLVHLKLYTARRYKNHGLAVLVTSCGMLARKGGISLVEQSEKQ
jgi:hypothetical protein